MTFMLFELTIAYSIAFDVCFKKYHTFSDNVFVATQQK